MIKLNKEQTEALNLINTWLKNKDSKEFILGGYAGTGKTTLLGHLINQLDEEPICCCPTGKAAYVLRKKLNNINVTTIHRVLYDPFEPNDKILYSIQKKLNNLLSKSNLKPDDNNEIEYLTEAIVKRKDQLAETPLLGFNLKLDLTQDLKDKLIIVDESSMATKSMREDMLACKTKILWVGDPGQLPAVKDVGWFINVHDKGEFDYVLNTVQRQALESPIIRISMEVRNNNLDINQYKFGDAQIIKIKEIEDYYTEVDQVLVGMNQTRFNINKNYRLMKKIPIENKIPVKGEKVICLKNGSYESQGDMVFLVNGLQGITTKDAILNNDNYMLDIEFEGESIQMLETYTHFFKSNYSKVKHIKWSERRNLAEFDYAYAITVHKSQGSEWDSVLVVDDGLRTNDSDFRKRWLYTAVTRAKNKLLLAI